MYNTRNKTQKAYRKNKPNLNLIPKNCVFVFPIELVGGKTQVSNLGIMPNRRAYDKGSFLYWQEVFDGRSALKLQWENSITLEKPEGQNYYLAKPSIGTYYYGKPISAGSESLEISEDASFEDFMSMKATQSVTLRFEYDPTDRYSSKWELEKNFRFKLVDNDIYNLYQIPELCENKLMYISDHQEYYDDEEGLSKGCEITFSTLGDKIQKSGKAIEQYCSWNAPGEFSVRPKVIEYYTSETEWEKQVIIDPIAYYYPTPIKYLQVEQQGPALTSTIYAIGRRQEWVEVTDPETQETTGYWKIGPSKFLLPCEFITTQPNPLNRSSTPTKNFYCLPDEQVTMVTNNEVLKWMLDTATAPLEQVKNNGMISIGSNWNEDGSHIRTTHPSNPIGSNGIRKDYYDPTWYPTSYIDSITPAIQQPSFDTSGCIYAADTISYKNTDTMVDIMCKNAFIFNAQPIIPLSYYDSRPLYLRSIPIIGSIANFFKLGDIKLSSRTIARKNSSLCYFCDCSLADMLANINGSTEEGKGTFGTPFKTGACMFPVNFFGTNEDKYQKLGVGSVNTTFCVALTDQLNIDGVGYDTIYLAQKQKEDGTWILPSHNPLQATTNLKPMKPASSNFIIDAVVVQSIFDGKIRMSCYPEEENEFIYPEWTATILSNANWENGNMRDWTNVFMLSNWEERFCKQQDEFTWPKAPTKPDTNDYVWECNISSKSIESTNCVTNWQSYQGNHWTNTQEFVSGGLYGANCPQTIKEETITYSNLGVNDKDDFLSTYKRIEVDFDGTNLNLSLQPLTSKGYRGYFDLQTATYEYEKEFYVCGVRDPICQFSLTPTSDEFLIYGDFITMSTSKYQIHYKSQPQIKVEVLDSGVKMTIKDMSNILVSGSVSEMEANKPFSNMKVVNGKFANETFNSTIVIPKITFKKTI